MPTDLYTILNVSKTASQQDIKAAYRRLAIRYHPVCCSCFPSLCIHVRQAAGLVGLGATHLHLQCNLIYIPH